MAINHTRETDRLFEASGVQLVQPTSGQFHFRHATFSTHLKAKVGSTLAKAAVLRVNLNLDGSPITCRLCRFSFYSFITPTIMS